MPGKLKVRLVKAADRELDGVADRYNEERAGLGDDFLRVVRATIDDIAMSPSRWPRSEVAHNRVLRRFPFTIHYRFDTNEVVVLAIAHHRRRPGYWSYRR